MANILVGIFEACTPAALEAALQSEGLDTSRLKVVTREARSDAHEDSSIDFVFAPENVTVASPSEEMEHGTGMLSDSGGTSVPGLSPPTPTLVGFTGGASANYLAGFPIRQDEVGNYNDAVDAGRCVVVYTLAQTDDSEARQAAFRAAGFKNIRVF